ncbi:SCO family protein [Phenylobacterium sp.]|jgi:protein SCO1/2|uniref:SCO family protein n=1 Tax=Phenylobacterium sp. TaxID=1871053 RepID=UPI00378406C9
MRRRTLAIVALLALAFAILTALALRSGVLKPVASQTAAVGGPFQLVDQSGRTVDQRLLKGKWSAVFFGFTHCPDVCPTTLFALGEAEKTLGGDAKDFQTVFISVDPERDTAKLIGDYLANPAFPKKVWGLTGTPEQVAAAAKAYYVYYRKAGDGPEYNVDHSTITYLMNPRGELACVIQHGATPGEIAGKVRTAMKTGSGATSC